MMRAREPQQTTCDPAQADARAWWLASRVVWGASDEGAMMAGAHRGRRRALTQTMLREASSLNAQRQATSSARARSMGTR